MKCNQLGFISALMITMFAMVEVCRQSTTFAIWTFGISTWLLSCVIWFLIFEPFKK